MKENNLDDLIIDNMESKSNHGLKNLLSILALIIIILIVAILLTKIILKDPQDDKMIFDQNYTQMVNPELRPTTQGNKSISSQQLSNIVEEEVESLSSPEESQEVAPETIEQIEDDKSKAQEPTTPKPIAPEAVTPKPATEQPTAPKPAAEQPTATAYYIQVGSFTTQPSKSFLSVIENHGYKYTIKQSGTSSKLLIGPYSSKSEADKALPGVRDRVNKSAFVVTQ